MADRRVIPADRALAETPVAFNFSDVRAMAASLLRSANGQAQKLLADARAQVAAMERRARDEGLAKGLEEGRAKGEAEGRQAGEARGRQEAERQLAEDRQAMREGLIGPAAAALGAAAATLQAQGRGLAAQAEGGMLRLVMDLVRRVTGAEMSLRPGLVAHALHEAIRLIPQRGRVRLRVNPEDHAVLAAELPALGHAFPDLGEAVFEPDPGIARGGLVALTREGEVDVLLATRLAAFERVLLGVDGEDALPPWSSPDPGAHTELPVPAPPAPPGSVLPDPDATPAVQAPVEAAGASAAPPVPSAPPGPPAQAVRAAVPAAPSAKTGRAAPAPAARRPAAPLPRRPPPVSAAAASAPAAPARASVPAPVPVPAPAADAPPNPGALPPIDPETGLPEGMTIEQAIAQGLITQEDLDAAIRQLEAENMVDG